MMNKNTPEVFILSAVRSPIGRGREDGALAPLSPVDLSAQMFQEATNRANIAPELVEDVALARGIFFFLTVSTSYK